MPDDKPTREVIAQNSLCIEIFDNSKDRNRWLQRLQGYLGFTKSPTMLER